MTFSLLFDKEVKLSKMSFKDNFKTIVHSNYRDTETYDMDDIIIHNTSIETSKGKLQYLLFDFDKEVAPGVYEKVYKAIKLVKLKRIPKKDLTIATFLQMQEGVITGYYQNQVNYIQIMANIMKPKHLGLIYAYGCQGISTNSIEEAKHSADIQMEALEKNITGTFRTLEYIDLTAEDARWIYQKLGTMDDMRIIRGVPGAKKTQGRIQSNTFFPTENEAVEEQSEEFLMGMDDYEYIFVLTATSVEQEVISKWKEAYLKESTYWASLQNGTKSMQFGLSMPMVYAANIGTSQGWGSNTGENFGENWGENQSHSVGTNESFAEGTTHSVGSSHSLGTGTNNGISSNQGHNIGSNIGSNIGQSVGQSVGSSYGESYGTNQGVSVGESSSFGTSSSTSQSTGTSESFSSGITSGESYGTNQSISSSTSGSVGTSSSTTQGTSTSTGGSYGTSSNYGGSSGWNAGVSQGSGSSMSIGANGSILGFGVNGSTATNQSTSSSSSMSGGQSWGSGTSSNSSWSTGTSASNSYGTSTSQGWSNGVSEGTSHTTSVSNSSSHSMGTSSSTSVSNGVNESHGTTYGQNYGSSYGQSTSSNIGTSIGSSRGESVGSSTGQSWGNGTSSGSSTSESFSTNESFASSQTHSVGSSVTDSSGTSHGVSTGKSIGKSISGSTTSGTSSSMGIGPSLSFGKSFMWEDREVSHILDLLNFSTQRIIQASNGAGMWFTDIYIATDTAKAAATATGLAMSAWHDKNILSSPLQVYKPSEEEKEYLFKHLSVFSPSNIREGVPGQFESYKYTTLLLSSEIAAYSHPPRANIGGIQAAIDDPPVLTIPGDRQDGEIFLGYVADAEKYSKERGYKSSFKYTLSNNEIHHAYISGASRSGKTVAARRMVSEAYANCRRGEKKKKLRFLIMDPKQDWRALAKIVPNKNFRFYSLSDPTYHPIRMNLLKIPKGVYTERYADKLREIFIRSYGLGDRGFQLLGKAIRAVYKRAGCYDEHVKYNKYDELTGLYPATERSKNITLEDVCKQLTDEMDTTKQRDKVEAIQRILDRLESFSEPESSIYAVFCNRGEGGMGIDDLLGEDDVIVLESYGMDTKTSGFIFGLITSGVYQYAVSNGGFVQPENQYETVLVIEEANQVLIGEDQDNLGGANPFEVILDQSAGYGLFIWTLTQKISDMPRSVLANSAIKIIGRQDDENDIKKSIVQIGKEGMITDRVFKNWLPDQPTGWFIVKSSRNRDFTKNAPTHVLVEYLDIEPPTNEELENILELGELERKATNIQSLI